MKIAWKLIALHVYVFNNLKYVSCWFYYRSSLQKKPKVPFIFISFAVFKILLLRNMYAFFVNLYGYWLDFFVCMKKPKENVTISLFFLMLVCPPKNQKMMK